MKGGSDSKFNIYTHSFTPLICTRMCVWNNKHGIKDCFLKKYMFTRHGFIFGRGKARKIVSPEVPALFHQPFIRRDKLTCPEITAHFSYFVPRVLRKRDEDAASRVQEYETRDLLMNLV